MIGDIVMTPIPYTDLSDLKVRPAVLLAEVGLSDWLVCEVTSSRLALPRRIEIYRRDLQAGRLDRQSWARPDRLFALHESVFQRTIARLTDAKLAEVLAATRSLF